MPNILLEYTIILSKVHSVIQKGLTPTPQVRAAMHFEGVIHHHPKPVAPCTHKASCTLTPTPWSKARHTSSCDEEIYIPECSDAIVGNPQHNFRWGDSTSLFQRHSLEIQSKFQDTKIGFHRKYPWITVSYKHE